jgi:release factor glutamine methyltransferase
MGSEIICAVIMTSNQPLPEEYIDGYVIFMGRRFITDKRALIPRLETEELVKYCFKIASRNSSSIQTVADIGTGSGIIPISIAEKIERPLQVFATDMSRDALELASENADYKNTAIHFLQ